jgi:replicative DNA helicase
MSEIVEKETLDLGEGLELQIIKNIISSRNFLVSVIEHIEPKFFENATARICISITKDHFAKFSDTVTANILKAESRNYLTPKDDEHLFLRELEIIGNLPLRDETYLKAKVLEHCQFQALKRAILKSADLLVERGQDFKNKINESIKKALSITENSDLGLNYFKNPEERIVSEMKYKKFIKTGLTKLDDILNGGWSAEDTPLVAVVAPTGMGKSIFLCKFGSVAIWLGHKVVHFTHELADTKTAARYDSLLTNIGQSQRLARKDELIKKLEILKSSYGEILRIKEFPTKSCSPNMMRAYLEKLRDTEGFVPELIINDYLDLMVANFNAFTDNDYAQQKRVSEELRGIAQEFEVPIITASQTNRGGSGKDVVEEKGKDGQSHIISGMISGTDIAESYGKVFTSDLLLTVNQTMQDRMNGKCNLFVAKNRNGKSGDVIPLSIIYEMMNITDWTPKKINLGGDDDTQGGTND